MLDKVKEFFVSSWAIENRTAIYVMTILLCITGVYSYFNLPKEKFPDIVVPTIYVSTIYPGTAPKDMENLVTKPIEEKIKSISGIKKYTSNSLQNFSNIIIEFNTSVNVDAAKQKIKDAVDKAAQDLPKDLPSPPNVQEINFSDFPILFVNISGDYDLSKLKAFAEIAEERIEALPQITRVDIVGARNREIQINVDKYKMEAASVNFGNIEQAVAAENRTVPGGTVTMDGVKRSINISGEFKDMETIRNMAITSANGGSVYLRDIAEVRDNFADKESYARLDGKNVVTLNIIKKAGQNLIQASDGCRAIVETLKKEGKFPKSLNVVLTGDQSRETRVTLHDLINTIIIGFILVVIILMFFMGVTNAFFVAMSVPLSCFLAFLIMPTIGFSLNMIVLFAFLLALGIVVDDAIVVIENTHRIYDNGKVPIKKAAKEAAGEVFLPVLSGTATTLAPFVPLAFWPGIIGKFMYFLPVTLIITLVASLIIAYVINPVFAVDFMQPHIDEHTLTQEEKRKNRKAFFIKLTLFAAVATLFYALGIFGMGNLTVFVFLLITLNQFVLSKLVRKFQEKGWPAVQDVYKKIITWVLGGYKPVLFLVGTMFLLVFSFVLIGIAKPRIDFFPKADPNFVNTFITLPIGTDQAYTDSLTSIVEKRVTNVMHKNGKKNPLVESIISNVTIGASADQNDRSPSPNKGKVSVAFVEFGRRNGVNTRPYLEEVRTALQGIPGIEVSVDQESGGPPVGAPIAVEIQGDDLDELVATGKKFKKYVDSLNIKGIEDLRSDVQTNSPQLSILINRERANREGLFTAQIGAEMRTAVFGKEVSKYKDDKDDYPIQLRYQKDQRDNIAALLNHKMTFRDMNKGGILRQVPVSAVADMKYDNTFGGIKRKNGKRIITLSSGVITGFNANEIVGQITEALPMFQKPETITIKMGGEQEQQKETGAFLGGAGLTALGLIFMILVLQFNSFGKPIIILSEILFSVTGVLLGIAIFGMNISIIMTGIGIVALSGIVVRNGILMVEFTDMLIEQGMDIKEAIIEAGRTRMTPVILTATATILGLVPLAVGLNMDFVTLFTELNPHIYFGGDSVAFWGPLSWTMIFGLAFATFLTLVLVPAMYLLYARMKGLKQKTPIIASNGVDIPINTSNGHSNGVKVVDTETKIVVPTL